MSEKVRLRLRAFIQVMTPFLVVVILIGFLFEVYNYAFEPFDPKSAVVEIDYSISDNIDWQSFPLTSPDTKYVAKVETHVRTGATIHIVGTQSLDHSQAGLKPLTSPMPHPYEGAWMNDDVLAIRMYSGALLWHWREARQITPSHIYLGIAGTIAAAGFLVAIIQAWRPTELAQLD